MNDGSVDGMRLFNCKPLHGMFVHESEKRVFVVPGDTISRSESQIPIVEDDGDATDKDDTFTAACSITDDVLRFSVLSIVCSGMCSDVIPVECDSEFTWRRAEIKALAALLKFDDSVADCNIDSVVCNAIDPRPEPLITNIKAAKLEGELLGIALSVFLREGKYDARARTALVAICSMLDVDYHTLLHAERRYTSKLRQIAESDDVIVERKKAAEQQKKKRWLAIGVGTLVGGALIGLTGGLAAPLVAVGAGAIFGTAGLVPADYSYSGNPENNSHSQGRHHRHCNCTSRDRVDIWSCWWWIASL